MDLYKNYVTSLLEESGITIGGPNDFDIQVNDDRFYELVAKKRSLGAGESFVKGYWQVEDLKTCAERVILFGDSNFTNHSLASNLLYRVSNAQDKMKSLFNVQSHYDLDFNLYQNFLDETLAHIVTGKQIGRASCRERV